MDNYFEKKLTQNQISFRFAKGKSLASGNEIHSYHEILYYMDGDATFLSADFKEVLTKGTLLIIPKETYHNFHIKKQESYQRFVVNFPDMDIIKSVLPCALSQIRIIKNINLNIIHILRRMCDVICDTEEGAASMFLYGAFLTLLSEISFDITNATIPKPREKTELVAKCLKYIDENYTSNITVADIAKKMYISQSSIFQCFNKELGVSIYKYITEKRLIFARKLIQQGENPTKIFNECGFGDYSTFYKAYKKMFLISPSKDRNTCTG